MRSLYTMLLWRGALIALLATVAMAGAALADALRDAWRTGRRRRRFVVPARPVELRGSTHDRNFRGAA